MKDITIIKMGSDKALYIVINAALGKKICNFRRSPIILLIFPDTILDGRQTLTDCQV